MVKSVQSRFRNTFGGAETLEANVSSGIKTRLAGHISLSAPLTPSLKTRWELQAFGVERDHTNFASCFEGARGVKAIIRVS
jgi:outer membrane protein insertion porin family